MVLIFGPQTFNQSFFIYLLIHIIGFFLHIEHVRYLGKIWDGHAHIRSNRGREEMGDARTGVRRTIRA